MKDQRPNLASKSPFGTVLGNAQKEAQTDQSLTEDEDHWSIILTLGGSPAE